jgi:hypothetical protein
MSRAARITEPVASDNMPVNQLGPRPFNQWSFATSTMTQTEH